MINLLQIIQEEKINKVSKFPIIRKQIEILRHSKSLIALIGSHGVGKTTLLLQYASEFKLNECLFFNASLESVIDIGYDTIVSEFYRSGGKVVIIDDIYNHPKWEEKLKKLLSKCRGLIILMKESLNIKAVSIICLNKKNLIIILQMK